MFSVPPPLQRLADQIDGWLDLRCPDKALDLLGALLADPAARPAGLAMRVRALARMARFADALPDLDELRRIAPPDEQDWIELTDAWCRKRTGDLPGAIACLERLLARDHRSDTAHFNLACYLALAGQPDRAVDHLALACGLNEQCRDFARDEPDLDPLRTDPRFRELLRQGGAGHDDADDDVDAEEDGDEHDGLGDDDPDHFRRN